MPTEAVAVLVILAMAAVTFATRAGGLWIMTLVPLTGRVEAFLKAVSGSVIVALVVPGTLNGDGATKLAVAVAIASMLLLRGRMPVALLAAMAAAAAYRALLA